MDIQKEQKINADLFKEKIDTNLLYGSIEITLFALAVLPSPYLKDISDLYLTASLHIAPAGRRCIPS